MKVDPRSPRFVQWLAVLCAVLSLVSAALGRIAYESKTASAPTDIACPIAPVESASVSFTRTN